MSRTNAERRFCLWSGFCLLAFSFYCHGQVTTASLEGRITDEESAGIVGATITIRNQNMGTVRETLSTSGGHYRVTALDPGSYAVTVHFPGFAIESKKDLILELGRLARVDFELVPLIEVREMMEVEARVPQVPTTESSIPRVVNEIEIQDLPLNTRNALELALLAPGVSAFRANTPPFSPLNFGASNNRGTRIYVDGIDFSSDMLGGILPSGTGVSQNAVDQFEVVTHGFRSEYGFTSAGAINVLTKAGTNEFHGGAFAFFRDESLNSSFYDGEDPYGRSQFGITAGGPILKDRTHFFVAYEGMREDLSASVDTGGAFPELEGVFVLPSRNTSFLAKVDHQISRTQSISARYSYGDNRGNGFVGGSLTYSNGQAILGNLNTILVSHKWVPSVKLLTELAVGYVRSDFDIEPFDSGPHLIYPSAEIGRWPGGEQHLNEDRWQFRCNVSYFVPEMQGQHNWKFGIDLSRVNTNESFDSLRTGLFIFPSDTAPLPFLAVIGDGNPVYGDIVNYKYAFYVQDDWTILDNLTLNLGLRYEIESNATNQNYYSTKTDPALPFIVRGNRPVDKDNLAPRLGVVWDPFHDGRTAIRGNFGIFFARVPADFSNGEIKSDQYRTFLVFNPGTTNRDQINLQGLPYQIEWLLPESVPMPYTRQFSIGFSRELTRDLALDVDYVRIRGYNEYFARNDVNPPNTDFSRPLPQYLEVFFLRADGRSFYDAIEVVLRKRIGQNYQVHASYTLSRAENDFDEPHFAGQLFKRGPEVGTNAIGSPWMEFWICPPALQSAALSHLPPVDPTMSLQEMMKTATAIFPMINRPESGETRKGQTTIPM